jgi:hypothetical protein
MLVLQFSYISRLLPPIHYEKTITTYFNPAKIKLA